MKRVQHGKSAAWKKCNMKKVQHEKSTAWKKCKMEKVEVQPGPRKHLRQGALKQQLTTLLIITAKLTMLDVCGAPGYTSGDSTILTKGSRKKKKENVNSATGEESKTNILQRVKVRHEIEQYIKRVQHERTCNIKMVQYEKSPT